MLAPRALAGLLSWVLSNMVLYHPFQVGSLSLALTARGRRLMLRLVAEDVGFGNPATGFRTTYFVTARRVEAEASVDAPRFASAHWARFVARPAQRRVHAGGLSAMSSGEGYAAETVMPLAKRRRMGPRRAMARAARAFRKALAKGAGLALGAVGANNDVNNTAARTSEDVAVDSQSASLLGVIRVERLQVDGVGLSFEMGELGEFNVNGVTRSVAVGDLLRSRALPADRARWPNRLLVRVARARGLPASDLGGTSDVKLVLTCRHHRHTTAVHYNTLAHLWDETVEWHVTDPSAVLHLGAFDVGMVSKDRLLAQWHTTLKSLVLRHGGELEGWVALRDKRGVKQSHPGVGELQLHVRWSYEEGFAARCPPPPRLSAMEQMEMDSQETAWRIADFQNAKRFLDQGFPYEFDLRALEIDDVHLRMKELFERGSEAAAELDERAAEQAETAQAGDTEKAADAARGDTDDDARSGRRNDVDLHGFGSLTRRNGGLAIRQR